MTIKQIQEAIKLQRANSFKNSSQLSLGQLIFEIEKAGLKRDNGEDKYICYDFGTAHPTKLHSWRGIYAELALGYELGGYDTNDKYEIPTASKLLEELKSAIGKEYEGWKGGEFIMSEDTPVWVANQGNAGNTGILGILDDGYRLVIITFYCES